MTDGQRVLLVEDPDADYPTEGHLTQAGFDVDSVGNVEETLGSLSETDVDCIVCCQEVPDADGLLFLGGIGVLRAVRERFPELPFVLFTEVGNEELAREAIAAGVTDYVRRGGEEGYERLVSRIDGAIAHRRTEARAERQARINEVIRDVNQALVRADTRTQIEQSVAEQLAQSEQYVLTWIAEVEEESVLLRAMGVEGAAIEGGSAIDISGDTAYTEPVQRAARERTPVIVDDPDEGTWEAALDRPPAAVAAIPFVYENRVYGVLVVYTDREGAFDGEERRVLAEVGENAAYAMNAVAVRRKSKVRELELRRQNERLEEFAEVVSHDLRNPITVAMGYVRMLDGDDEAVEKIEDSLSRMEAIIENVLALARQGRTVGEPEPVDLTAAAKQAWSNVDTAKATLATEGDFVEADRSRLVQLLENLFRNAVEHGSSETVQVRETDVGFYVSDDGTGLPDEDVADLFQFGFTTAGEGTGFGLSIVRSIAEAHGWGVAGTESEAGGARFEFSDVTMPEDDEFPVSGATDGEGVGDDPGDADSPAG